MSKTKKTKSIFTKIINIFFIFMFLSGLSLGTFFILIVKDTSLDIKRNEIVKQTIIYDKYNNQIETIGKEDDYVYIHQIPKIMINALLSIEDSEFYYHDGINLKSIISSLVNNIFSSQIRGGSTLTQQLIKNTALTSERTLTRKIKEAYLSCLMEKQYSKEEILELYFNKVYFEQSVPGINYASKYFFNKPIEGVNYIEASILASLVKSPSLYHPINHPENANKRKDLVLERMYKQKVITENEYHIGLNTKVENIIKHDSSFQESLKYQAYLDVVYEEVKALTGKDLYTHPLIVETYLDTYIQGYIDLIQNDQIISFSDENQQIGGVILDNDNSKIIGIIGGRNYQGKKLFNRAYHLRRNPASTMKPILSYALGIEYLSLHPLSLIKDEEYFYQGTSIRVNNADRKYLGSITLIDALGYSRNTCAVRLFDSLVNKIGINKIRSYLLDIGIMDEGTLTSSYALGGMTYGTSPILLSGAYSMLSNHGYYLKPSTIKSIKDYSGKVIYSRDTTPKKVLNEESADIITYSLSEVINQNYLNINIAKPSKVNIAGKTGTNAYDKQTINKLNFPSNADKDIWFAGYSPNATCVIWTGFDDTSKDTNYFTSKDERKKIAKLVFNKIMSKYSNKEKFTYSDKLKEVYVVKGLEETYYPNEYIPSRNIGKTLIDPSKINIKTLPSISIEEIDKVTIYSSNSTGVFQVKTPIKEDEIYSSIYGNKTYGLKVITPSSQSEELYSADGYFEYEYKEKGKYQLEFFVTFSNNTSLKGSSYNTYLFTDNFF